VLEIHVLAMRANRSGGADVYTADLVRRLAERGHHITLVCYEADAALAEVCTVHLIRRRKYEDVQLAWRFAPLLYLLDFARSINSISMADPDVIVGSATQLTWMHARRFPRSALMYVPHSLVAPREIASYPWVSPVQRAAAVQLYRRAERAVLNRAARTVRFTNAGCQALLRYYGARIRPAFSVFPIAVRIPAEPAPHVSHDGLRLLSVGRLVNTKNVQLLIDVLALLRHRRWHLDIVGDGPERGRLEHLVRERGLLDRIAFRGHQTDVDRWYRTADLLVSTSRLEYSPLALLEAMSHGIPTLSIGPDGDRYHNANDEIVCDGVDGFLARSEERFGQMLAGLLSSPSRLADAGARAREAVIDRHQWSDHIDRYEGLFDEIRARPQARTVTCASCS
jgi:glycosyltransferase involved in cell wall biosynthesis